MALRKVGSVALPPSARKGGFDHAAVHRRSGLLYVAHTANDSVEVIDGARDEHLRSINGLTGVAGALVSDERELVFTSNRGENTVGVFPIGHEDALTKVGVGVRPNGLAFDPERQILLAANVGDPAVPGSHTLSIVDVGAREMIASIPVPGRTRWTIFEGETGLFYVNIGDPPRIAVIDAVDPRRVTRWLDVPAVGPHGLDLDPKTHELFCACDGKALVTLDAPSGRVLHQQPISGVPDVIFFNAARRRLYIAIGDPGVIDVFDTERRKLLETVPTEKGAHTIGFDAERNKVYAFLPDTHRALVFVDEA